MSLQEVKQIKMWELKISLELKVATFKIRSLNNNR
jgi:hypothetical protein